MKRIISSFLLALLALGTVWGQEDLIGVWEMVDDEDFSVYEFRADGILIQNEYYEGDLECIYIFPYEVDGDVLIWGEGLNWEFDADTGEFELYEEFADETGELSFTYEVSDGELNLALSDELMILGMLEFADELDIDPEGDLDLDLGDPEAEEFDLSDEDIETFLEAIFLAVMIDMAEAEFGISLDDFDIDPEADFEEVFSDLVGEIILAELELELEIEIGEDVEIDLEGDVEDVAVNIGEALGLEEGDLEELDLEELEQILEEFDLIVVEIEEGFVALGEATFAPSSQVVIAPLGAWVLPNGMTAVEEVSWGDIKKGMSRR